MMLLMMMMSRGRDPAANQLPVGSEHAAGGCTEQLLRLVDSKARDALHGSVTNGGA